MNELKGLAAWLPETNKYNDLTDLEQILWGSEQAFNAAYNFFSIPISGSYYQVTGVNLTVDDITKALIKADGYLK